MTFKSNAQYTLLNTDPVDASMSGVADVKTLSYKMDIVADSIWFKVETHNSMITNCDFGIMFGIDTNQNPADGQAWGGMNTSMRYDQALFVQQNGIFPGYFGYLGIPGTPTMVPVSVTRPDSYTFIIRVKLTLLDPNHKFNMITGTGFFNIHSNGVVYDDVPNSGKFTIQTALQQQYRSIVSDRFAFTRTPPATA